jgi:predicted transcriptional regulator
MLTREPSLFEETEAEAAAADAEGLADVEAGRVISHEAMKAWLLSWGKPDELPPPEIGD